MMSNKWFDKGWFRWALVVAATIAMALVSVYEYSWTLYTVPLGKIFHISPASPALGLTYTIYIIVQALSMFVAGRIADRYGPRLISIIGGLLTGIGYISSAFASSLPLLYLTYGFGSIGVGIIYGTAISTAVRWFPDKRGLATGIIEIGFGGGSFALSPLIQYIISTISYRAAFIDLGIIQLILITTLAILFAYPPPQWLPKGFNAEEYEKKRKLIKRSKYDFKFTEMIKTWQWWIIYISFFLIAGSGLSIVGHLIPYGKSLGFSIAAIIGVFLFPFANGLGRFVMGTISDYLGRPYTMTLSFGISGISMISVAFIPKIAPLFLALIFIIAFTWGPLFSLFPPTIGDYYGPKYSGTNYGITYTAKALAGIFAGYGASVLFTNYGIKETLVITGLMAIGAAILALTLKPPKISTEIKAREAGEKIGERSK
ncbi:MAG: MFS transporter [Saccharolobus sp.]|uniref:MFS transporter n=1 Tax=Saccharolobus sp. TaxID=2100761 RepID=UPI003162DAC8